MDLLIDLLCIKGSELASTDFEKDLVIWIAQHDSDIMGSGATGFDICEMPWNIDTFEDQKNFIFNVLHDMLKEAEWKANISDEAWIVLKGFILNMTALIENFNLNHVDVENQLPIFEFDNGYEKYNKCEIHGVYYHSLGCVICGQ